MSWMIERRLRRVGRRLAEARSQLEIAEEQLLHLADDSSDAEIRALVSEDRTAAVEHHEAARHRDAMARHRDDLREAIVRLEGEQDALLDQLTAAKGPGPVGGGGR